MSSILVEFSISSSEDVVNTISSSSSNRDGIHKLLLPTTTSCTFPETIA